MSLLSWIAAIVPATLLAVSQFWRWLASSAAGSSLLLAASLADSSAMPLPACHLAGRPLLTCCCSVRWLGIQLQCTSGLAARASARHCQQLPARTCFLAFLLPFLLPALLAVYMCNTALQSVITMPPRAQAPTAQAAAAASPAQTVAPIGR